MSPRRESGVHVTHEWGRLEEAIVGIQPSDRFILPVYQSGWTWMPERFARLCREHAGEQLIDVDPEFASEIQDQADGLAALLEGRGIRVRRVHYPEGEDNLAGLGTGEGTLLFARDPILVVGHNIIELTLTEAWRFRERFAVRPILADLSKCKGVNWVAMPPPAPSLPDADPRLEGGDILLNGHEIYVGCTGFYSNRAGADWLQNLMGPGYQVFPIPLPLEWMHLDGALCLLRDGLALRAPDAFSAPLPGALTRFEFIDVRLDEADDLGCNALILDDSTVVMDTRPLERIAREMELNGIDVIHYNFDAVQAYGGGMRCWHHPVRRVV
jgi:glycine amidinotransferase